MILNTLEYDGQIEKIDSPDGEDRFRQALLAIPETSAFTSIPCGVCPVSFHPKPSTQHPAGYFVQQQISSC